MEFLFVLIVVIGALYWGYRRVNRVDQQEPSQSQSLQPEEKTMIDYNNLSQADKDAVYEYTKNLTSDRLAVEEQIAIINKAAEVGIPADKILMVIAQSWNGRPDMGDNVTEDMVFGYFKDVDPSLLGRPSPIAVSNPVFESG